MVVIILLAIAAALGTAEAHGMYQAAVLLDVQGRTVDATLELPVSRVEKALGLQLDGGRLTPGQREQIDRYVQATVTVAGVRSREPRDTHLATIDGAPYVTTRLRFPLPEDASFALESSVLLDRVREQVTLVSLRSDWATATFAREPKLLGVLRGETRTLTVDRAGASWLLGFRSLFTLGLKHIGEGTDHLLFLLVLLLPVSRDLRAYLWRVARIVTAFTAGHSLTLALGALGLARVPSQPVEVAIAVSILVSAIHAWRPLFAGREGWVAAGFGLVHGLAFATTLEELGLRGRDLVAGLASFNLGIEAMQFVVVAAALPSLLLSSRTPWYPALRSGGALLAALAALGWLAERLGLVAANPLAPAVAALADRAPWLALALTAAGFCAWSFAHWRTPRLEENPID